MRSHLWLDAPFALNRPLVPVIKWDQELPEPPREGSGVPDEQQLSDRGGRKWLTYLNLGGGGQNKPVFVSGRSA